MKIPTLDMGGMRFNLRAVSMMRKLALKHGRVRVIHAYLWPWDYETVLDARQLAR